MKRFGLVVAFGCLVAVLVACAGAVAPTPTPTAEATATPESPEEVPTPLTASGTPAAALLPGLCPPGQTLSLTNVKLDTNPQIFGEQNRGVYGFICNQGKETVEVILKLKVLEEVGVSYEISAGPHPVGPGEIILVPIPLGDRKVATYDLSIAQVITRTGTPTSP